MTSDDNQGGVGMTLHDYQVVGYMYQAAEYCPACVVREILERSRLEGHGLSHIPTEALGLMARFRGIDMQDESSYDSDDWPKVVLGYQAEEHESVCDRCGGVLTSMSTDKEGK